MGIETTGRLLPWRRILSSHKHTLLWPLLLVSLFFVFLNSKMRYIVEDPNYRKFWHSAAVPPRSLSAVATGLLEASPSGPPSSLSPLGGGGDSGMLSNFLSTSTSNVVGGGSGSGSGGSGRRIEEECSPRINAVFLKTHKCAGSTVQNIFMRYGNVHNLTFALPRRGNYMGHPVPFEAQFVPDPKRFNVTYNFLVHHNRLSYPSTRQLMPSNSVYVTVLRDPGDLFESMYSYYGLFAFYKMPLESLFRLPKSSSLLNRRSSGKFGVNQMLFDLGFPSSQFKNETAVKEYVKWLDTVFSLVMISDKMDESLILLKNLMCWRMDDVVVFKLNARSSRFKTKLTPAARNHLKKLNGADQILYEHFLAKLERQINVFGREKMSEELLLLQNRTDFWYRTCVRKQEMLKRLKTSHQHEANPRVLAYMPTNTSNSNCWGLTIPELEFTDHLRAKQTFYQKEAQQIAKEEEVKRKRELPRNKMIVPPLGPGNRNNKKTLSKLRYPPYNRP